MRRLLNLVRHLPPEGAVGREIEPEWWWWHPSTEFLAQMLEVAVAAFESGERLRAVSTGRKFRQVTPPEIPRPWRRRRRNGFADLLASLPPGDVEFVRKEG